VRRLAEQYRSASATHPSRRPGGSGGASGRPDLRVIDGGAAGDRHAEFVRRRNPRGRGH
jgi:hypothetical protein